MTATSTEESSASQVLDSDELDFELHDRQGGNWTDEQKSQLSRELHTFASTCLFPLPDYNCLSSNFSTAFDDKIIAIARSSSTKEIVGFTSTVFLTGFNHKDVPFVIHTGLTCVSENLRRKKLTIFLFYHIFIHLSYNYPEGFWLSSLSGIISSLGSISRYGTNVYPSPISPAAVPSPMHRLIAKTIDLCHRDKMLISSNAVFDSERFVFIGSNKPGSCFYKDRDDVRYADRYSIVNDFYRKLLRKDGGDGVLQIAFMDSNHVLGSAKYESRFEKLKNRESKL